MIDLKQALGTAADAATAHRPGLAAGPVLQRIHRRRAVRVAAESTVGVAAAGAVAFGGVQLAGRGDEPLPPATPTTTPTPSPTPTSAPAPLVTGAGPLGCGLPVPALDDPAGTADVHVELQPGAATLTEGDATELTLALVNGTDQDVEGVAADAVRLLAARDGVVVGGLVVPEGAAAGTLAAGSSLHVQGAWATAACDGEGLGAAPLAAGTYELFADWGLDGGIVVGGPWTLTVEAAADPHPALADLVVSTSGLGPLTIGLPPATNPGAAMIAWDPDHCAELSDTDPGRWLHAGYEDDPDRGDPGKHPFSLAVDDTGVVAWIDVFSPAPRTSEGVGRGTTVPELQAAYPALQGPFDGAVSRVWWIEDAAGVLVFETQGDADGLQPAGTPEQVILMRVLLPGSDPQFATANTDWVAGGCM